MTRAMQKLSTISSSALAWVTTCICGGADDVPEQSLGDRVALARKLYRVYTKGYAFPMWSIDMLEAGDLESYAATVTVFYLARDDFSLVKKMATEREPCNIAMNRLYDANMLHEMAGYRSGAYGASTLEKLMPNIAIYCKTPLKLGDRRVDVHVINIVGFAFDSTSQPDYQYFFKDERMSPEKVDELVKHMMAMWRYIFECATLKNLQYIQIADVGGGAFSTYLMRSPETSYNRLKQASLSPVIKEYPGIEVQQLERIPDCCFSGETSNRLDQTLLVNAWDPWSMVGNGNALDNSLDGFFGDCSAMAVLCWPPLNPKLTYQAV
eukprot:TRINITY_DN3820_c0_g1_i1.p1 TRINITY_DN3820_c0_g1~~TRINITY_DN3820_c0_g1_i1.p1  ORF type:complete len:323 (+),score=43.32 TRINITY_DN3820_c0_g1_i1:150-1118(+)